MLRNTWLTNMCCRNLSRPQQSIRLVCKWLLRIAVDQAAHEEHEIEFWLISLISICVHSAHAHCTHHFHCNHLHGPPIRVEIVFGIWRMCHRCNHVEWKLSCNLAVVLVCSVVTWCCSCCALNWYFRWRQIDTQRWSGNAIYSSFCCNATTTTLHNVATTAGN